MRPPSVMWALCGFDGRVNREVYWLGNLFTWLVAAVLAMPSVDPVTGTLIVSPVFPFAVLIAAVVQIALAVKRLHDRNLTGWFAMSFVVPIVGIVAFFIIGLVPGDPGPNQFGRATNQRG